MMIITMRMRMTKQSDDTSAEVDDEKNVDVISKLIYYGVKTLS